MNNLRNLVYTSLLVSMALAVSLIETFIPLPFVVPGFKLGLSNMIIMVTLIIFGFKGAFFVAILKSVLLMLIIGFGPRFIYSLAGAILATLSMGIVYKYLSGIFSVLGVSIIGGVMHNFAQLTVATYLLGSILLYTYLPFLTIVGTITGYFVGLGAHNVALHLRKLNIVT